MKRLFAISDLHLAAAPNRRALERIPQHRDDWLIVAGDMAEKLEHMELGFALLARRFGRVLWTPGNHELWSQRVEGRRLAGPEKYRALVEIAHRYGVITPEDPYPEWRSGAATYRIVLLFLLYDYSFRPDHVRREEAVAWAAESGVICSDEFLLDPAPYDSRDAWCAERIRISESRLRELDPGVPTILVNHFPLRRDLVWLPRMPRFALWCGTERTHDWHLRYGAAAVIHGHLHVRGTSIRDGVPFSEVSFGYPGQWSASQGMASHLHRIDPSTPEVRHARVSW